MLEDSWFCYNSYSNVGHFITFCTVVIILFAGMSNVWKRYLFTNPVTILVVRNLFLGIYISEDRCNTYPHWISNTILLL